MSWPAWWAWMRRWVYLPGKPVSIRVGRHDNRQECQTWFLALPDCPSRLHLSPCCWPGRAPSVSRPHLPLQMQLQERKVARSGEDKSEFGGSSPSRAGASLVAQTVKNLPVMRETQV